MSETVYNNEPGNDQVYDETIYGDDTAGQAYDEFGDNQGVYDQDDIIISAGSLYMIGTVRTLLNDMIMLSY